MSFFTFCPTFFLQRCQKLFHCHCAGTKNQTWMTDVILAAIQITAEQRRNNAPDRRLYNLHNMGEIISVDRECNPSRLQHQGIAVPHRYGWTWERTLQEWLVAFPAISINFACGKLIGKSPMVIVWSWDATTIVNVSQLPCAWIMTTCLWGCWDRWNFREWSFIQHFQPSNTHWMSNQ